MSKGSYSVMIEVRANDIRLGKRKLPRECPVALALNRSLDLPSAVEVRNNVALVMGLSRKHAYALGLSSRSQFFIGRYDRGKSVKPFRFRILVLRRFP